MISEVLYQGVLNEESNLKFFSTRCNYISDIGAKAMAMSLKTNKSLVHLNLWNNKISRDGCDALADALKINSTLCSLSLGKNPIGDDGAALLIKALSATQVANEELASRKRILEMKKEDEVSLF